MQVNSASLAWIFLGVNSTSSKSTITAQLTIIMIMKTCPHHTQFKLGPSVTTVLCAKVNLKVRVYDKAHRFMVQVPDRAFIGSAF